MLAFKLEGEVVGEMAAFVIASEEPESVGVPDLEGPQVEDALDCQSSYKLVGITDLDAEVTAINVVPKEEISCF